MKASQAITIGVLALSLGAVHQALSYMPFRGLRPSLSRSDHIGLATFLAGGLLLPIDPKTASAATKLSPFKAYQDRGSQFYLEYPSQFYVSRRYLDQDAPAFVTLTTATVFVATDLPNGVVVSVTQTSIRNLLQDGGYDPNGEFKSIQDIGKPAGVASLLVMDRDSQLKSNPDEEDRLSKVTDVESTDKTLSFKASTPINKLKGQDELVKGVFKGDTGVRISRAKAFLRSADNALLVVWSTADEKVWGDPALAEKLNYVVDSFDVGVKYSVLGSAAKSDLVL